MRALAEPVAAMDDHEDIPLAAPPALNAPHLALGADATAQLRWAQRMDALGRLTGRLVHEINNQVTVMLAHTSLLLQRGEAAPAGRADVEELHRAAERIKRLTRQWQALGRRNVPEPGRIDLNVLIAELAPAFEVVLGENLILATDLRAAPAGVLADRSNLEQVVFNLVLNARDAMSGRGTLTLRTASAELGPAAGDYLMSFRPGPYVLLEVRDTGCGMDRATLAHAFEPYFTTKGADKGTGLGLYNVAEIVRESGGTVQVTSAPGQGTVFEVYLPRADEAPQAPAAPPAPRPGRPTILLVDDEDSVRTLVREVLGREGYVVLEAADGRAALELAEAHAGSIDLLVADWLLPYVPGGELARRLSARLPALRVLFVSGYPPAEGPLAGAAAAFLQKPFAPATLTGLVRDLLARRL